MRNEPRERKAKRAYENPMRIIERHKAGEYWGLTAAIREYIYRSIKAREAYGEEFFEAPATIARKFRCKTRCVQDAVRDQSLLIRTGRDGDERRPWITCTDGRKRAAIKAGYKATPRRWKPNEASRGGENGQEVGEEFTPSQQTRLVGKTHEVVGKTHEESPPKPRGENPRHQKITPTPPFEDYLSPRPGAGGVYPNIERTDIEEEESRPLEAISKKPVPIDSLMKQETLRLIKATLKALPSGELTDSLLLEAISSVGVELVIARQGVDLSSRLSALALEGHHCPSSFSLSEYPVSVKLAVRVLEARDATLLDESSTGDTP